MLLPFLGRSQTSFMKVAKPKVASASPRFISGPVLLAIILLVLFVKSFLPGYVHFSNDGPLGQQNAAWDRLPGAFTGIWGDLNDIGNNGGSGPPGLAPPFSPVPGP